MGRPHKTPARTLAAIESAIAEEEGQLALLRNDLRDALILGESTRSLRGAIGETEKSIVILRAALAEAHAAEQARRHAEGAEMATELLDESHCRHDALMASLAPAFSPSLLEGFTHA